MKEVLFLCHRLPYPPNKGDKIRSYHLLAHLAQRYRVHLATFVDDPADWAHVPAVKALCASSCIRRLHPRQARLRSLTGLLTGTPLTVPYYRDADMARWVRRCLKQWPLSAALAFSSGMAPYLMQARGMRRVMDFVDVDSDKWRQYGETTRWPMNLLYRREARRLAAFEDRIARAFDVSLFVSDAEAALLRTRLPACADRIVGLPNGVNSDYFDPSQDYPTPYRRGERAIAFVGAMDYWANAEAAQWFAREVFPAIRARVPCAVFYIVGNKPRLDVLQLTSIAGVTVTGAVADVRPYVAHAHAVAAPLRIARGIQNKVLEALAMGKPLLATPQAYEGIDDFPERSGCVSESPQALADEAVRLLQVEDPAWRPAARQFVVSHYNWTNNLAALDRYLEG